MRKRFFMVLLMILLCTSTLSGWYTMGKATGETAGEVDEQDSGQSFGSVSLRYSF